MKQLLATIGGIVVVSVLVLVLLVAAKSFNDNEQTQTITTAALRTLATREAKVATAQAATATAESTTATALSATVTAVNDTATAQAKNTATAATALANQQGEYAVIKQSPPTTIKAGQKFEISFTLKNIGKNVWSATNGYQLTCIDDVDNIPCPSDPPSWCSGIVTSNALCDFDVTLVAPTHKGRYHAVWQLQHNKQSVAPQGKPYMYIIVIVT